ncbi:DUF1428 domain-containing protein [Neptunicella sp. SCSIO 80796]|uniref:DUF1428 domain-containing protein n=1 Tax=Neptunicella plasticusilytica TaxID=3117012 RepID=UPI003A4DD7F9
MSYVDGFVLAVSADRIDEYKAMAGKAAKVWKKHGALEYKECVQDDMQDKGFCMTFPQQFKPKEGELMVFAYVVYKSREHRDEVNAKVYADPEISEGCDPENMPFDCKRMTYGGFSTIVEV